MIIRREVSEDYNTIYSLVETAFSLSEHSDGNEQNLVNSLRKGDSFIPELSLVAEIDGVLVGYIMFTKAYINEYTVLVLAPLSVLPKYQKNGIGTALINEGHIKAKYLGYDYSIVLGSEKYYSKLGYVPAKVFGMKSPFGLPSEKFMAYKLQENAPIINGVVKYAKEFGIN